MPLACRIFATGFFEHCLYQNVLTFECNMGHNAYCHKVCLPPVSSLNRKTAGANSTSTAFRSASFNYAPACDDLEGEAGTGKTKQNHRENKNKKIKKVSTKV